MWGNMESTGPAGDVLSLEKYAWRSIIMAQSGVRCFLSHIHKTSLSNSLKLFHFSLLCSLLLHVSYCRFNLNIKHETIKVTGLLWFLTVNIYWCIRLVCFVWRSSPGLGWNGRVGRQSRLSSSSSTTEEDGIFVNSASSKLLERAHDILMSVTKHTHAVTARWFSDETSFFRCIKHISRQPDCILLVFVCGLVALTQNTNKWKKVQTQCHETSAPLKCPSVLHTFQPAPRGRVCSCPWPLTSPRRRTSEKRISPQGWIKFLL